MAFKFKLQIGKVEESNEIYSNVEGTVVEATESSVTVRDEEGLLHKYKNLVNVEVKLDEELMVGDGIGELNTDLYYSVEKEAI